MNAALPALAAAAGDSPTKNSRHKTAAAVFSCPVAIKRAQHTGIVHNSAADQLGQLQSRSVLSCPALCPMITTSFSVEAGKRFTTS